MCAKRLIHLCYSSMDHVTTPFIAKRKIGSSARVRRTAVDA